MKSLFHYDGVKFGNTVKKLFLKTFKGLDIKYLIILIIFVVSFLTLILCLSNKICSTQNIFLQQKKSNGLLLVKLNEIKDSLLILKSYSTITKQQEIAFQNIEKNIFSLQRAVDESAKTSEIQKISSQIDTFKNDVDAHMGELTSSIAGVAGNKQFKDASILPFHVIAVDVIAGQPYVSVDYANHIFPLAIGDVLSGWRVSSADYNSNSVEFINEKNEFVRLGMKGDRNEN